MAEFDDEVIEPMRDIAQMMLDENGIDFIVNDMGAMVAIMPVTEEAETWFERHVGYEAWQSYAGLGVVLERSYAAILIEAIRTEIPFTVGD